MARIKTQREYDETCERVTAMRGASERHRATLEGAGFPPEHVELGLAPLLTLLDQLEGDASWYEAARRGEIRPLLDLRNIGLGLIALRLAKGLTQRQLAERLGVNEAQVSNDEKNEYAGISVERAQRIIDALEGSVTVTVSPERPAPTELDLVSTR
jgi:DNA-binding XRE family transcriptional regulator